MHLHVLILTSYTISKQYVMCIMCIYKQFVMCIMCISKQFVMCIMCISEHFVMCIMCISKHFVMCIMCISKPFVMCFMCISKPFVMCFMCISKQFVLESNSLNVTLMFYVLFHHIPRIQSEILSMIFPSKFSLSLKDDNWKYCYFFIDVSSSETNFSESLKFAWLCLVKYKCNFSYSKYTTRC